MKRLINYLPLTLIILLSLGLRLIWLDKIPNGISGDELDYVLNAKTVFLTGKDISGQWSPASLFLFRYPLGEFPKAELPYFLMIPFVGPMKLSLLIVRLPFALLSTLIVLLIYLITKALLRKDVAIIAAFIAAINPWFIYIGRTAYEATPATLFYLFAIYILLVGKGWKILFALPFLCLGFYSYIATKLILLPLAFVVSFYAYWFVNKKRFLRQYLLICFLCVLLLIFFVLSLKNQSTSRMTEILTPNASEIIKQVDEARRASIKTPLTNLFENKITVFAKIVINKFLNIFSSNYLFVYGDKFFSLWSHGLFYYLDIIFLFLGFVILFVRQRKTFLFLSVLIFIGALPQVFHRVTTDNMATHISLVFPFLTILIALGIWYFNQFKNNVLLIVGLYLVFLLNFLHIYFFQHPLRGYFDFSVRLLCRYIFLNQDAHRSIFILTRGPNDSFKKYLFYTDGYTRETVFQIKKVFQEGKTELGKVKFVSCDTPIDFTQKEDLIIINNSCNTDNLSLNHLSISQLFDGGEVYKIYNDRLCSQYNLKRYPGEISINDFGIENLSKEEFCEKFIFRVD